MTYLILSSPLPSWLCLPIYKHLCPSFASSHNHLFSFTQPSTHQAHLSNHQNTFPSFFISVDNMSSALYYAGREEHLHHQSHFLEACFLCRKPLGQNSDIFMYRGNTPFCSQECRQEQMEIDEAKEKKSWKLSKRTSALRQTTTETSNKSSSPSKAVRTGTVVVA